MKWKIEERLIKDLVPHSKNPRKLTKDQYKHLKNSINKFGLIDKPIINKDNTLIGGHQRIEVLKKEKIKTVECWVPEEQLDQKQVDELNVRLNKNLGEWDFDILANEWDLNDLIEWGFTAKELEIGTVENIDVEDDKKKKKNTCPSCGHEF